MPRPTRIALLLFVATNCGSASTESEPSFADRTARLLSPKVRSAERRLAEIAKSIDSLPELYNGPRGSRFGFHSETIANQFEPHSVEIDLGRTWPIDSIVVIPVHLPTRGPSGEGYGFPLRFKIELFKTQNSETPELVVDHTSADFENPGRYPLQFAVDGTSGQIVRFTSTKHLPSEGGFIWALEELMVLSGNSNVAAGKRRSATSHEELFPNWSLLRLNDGISRLGYPWKCESSSTDGYLSAPSKSSTEGKWLVIDLEEPVALDEIRLVPTASDDPEVVGGRGFPQRLVLELSDDPEFVTTSWRGSSSRNPLGYPWKSAYARNCGGATGRYLRVTASELLARGNQHSFALAEVQAYSGGRNVALGKPVLVSDVTPRADASRWAPEFAVDGFSSTHRLSEWPEFVELVVHRGRLERERAALRMEREDHVETVSAGVTAGAGTLGGVAVFGWLWMLVRQRTLRRRDATRLREQIARDLHDDIGSNLGGIVLLSEVGSMHAGANQEILEDFREIKETAEQTSESMRDIVWLIHVGKSGVRDLVIQMRESVARILGDLAATVEIEPPRFRNRPLSLFLRRHFFFAFKETLNNVRKHARATNVLIRIMISPKSLTFVVADDGEGFDPENVGKAGHGLQNLKRRASRAHGRYSIESTPGEGTTVTFTAQFKQKNQ